MEWKRQGESAALGSLLLTNSNIDDSYQKYLILLLVNYSLILHTEAMIIMSEIEINQIMHCNL